MHSHTEKHTVHRIGWLRAAVLGANDGLISTASLVVGVAASAASHTEILIAGVAGMVAGAMSMAAGEYVSVSSQADSEKADIAKETRELHEQPDFELKELTQIYIDRGVKPETAAQVAKQLTEHNALGAHLRDELGITEITQARPFQAALTSALTFAIGAALPILAINFFSLGILIPGIVVLTLIFLGVLGYAGAVIGDAPPLKAILRVMFWGSVAMTLTALVGYVFGLSV